MFVYALPIKIIVERKRASIDSKDLPPRGFKDDPNGRQVAVGLIGNDGSLGAACSNVAEMGSCTS
jgi:hypothetical protein